MDFPGGPVVKKSACQCKEHQLHPWSGKIPRQGATKPVHHNCWVHEPVLLNRRRHHNEKPVHSKYE